MKSMVCSKCKGTGTIPMPTKWQAILDLVPENGATTAWFLSLPEYKTTNTATMSMRLRCMREAGILTSIRQVAPSGGHEFVWFKSEML